LAKYWQKPLELGQRDTAVRYERFLSSPGVQLVSFDRDAARIRPPDAIQLSCSATAGANLFITNDARLSQRRCRKWTSSFRLSECSYKSL
jgi:hypothetical protein